MNRVQQIARRPDISNELKRYQSRISEIVDLAVTVQQIPSPTFAEGKRAVFVESQFRRLGLKDVEQDELANVYGRYPGRGSDSPLVISAHSDTVFSEQTDLSVRRDGDRVEGPGIADNALGVAGLLTLAQSFFELDVRPERDVWFVANVGEEGLGDLRGMRAAVQRFEKRGIYLVLEGGLFGYICHQAIGVRRYRITASGPGGHSWGAFGTGSAVHVLGHLIAAIDRLEVPEDPKTTYNVGVIEGGTTINTIAQSASLLLDLRSEEPAELRALVNEVMGLLEQVDCQDDVELTLEQIGDRPAGKIERQAPLVRWAMAALRHVGCDDLEFTLASTDANIPLSLGLPAVCIGLTRSGHTHRPDEYIEIESIPAGLGQALLVALAAAGT